MSAPGDAAGDYRRAAAMIVHHARRDQPGQNAVVTEALQADRLGNLLQAVLHLYEQMLPELRSPLGLQLLSSKVVELAGMEEQAGEQ